MFKFLSSFKLPGIRVAAGAMLIVVAIQLWAKPSLEQTIGWGLDVWSARQIPANIVRPAPAPPPLAELTETEAFQKGDAKRKREILAIWATQAHLYARDRSDYNPQSMIPFIQNKVDEVAREKGLDSITNQHVDLGTTGRALINWAFLIVGVVLSTEFFRVWRASRKK